MKMSTEIRNYIVENHIDIDELAKIAGVKQSQLLVDASTPLNASELLAVCASLQMDPEYFWKKVSGGIHN